MDDETGPRRPDRRPAGRWSVGLAVGGAGVIVAEVVAVVWASTRGVNVTDEGFWLFLINRPEWNRLTSTSFGVLWHPLWVALDGSVPHMRIARLVVSLVLHGALAAALWRHLRPRLAPITAILWTIGVVQASFLAWTWAPPSPGYDATVGFLAVALTTLVLWYFAPNASPRWLPLAAGLAGVVTPLLMIVKWSSGAVACGLTLAVMVLGRRQSTLRTVGSFAVGAVGGFLWVHFAIVPLDVMMHGMLKGSSVFSTETHSLQALAGTYFRSLVATTAKAILLLGPLAAIAIFGRRWWLRRENREVPAPLDDPTLRVGFVVAAGVVLGVWGAFDGGNVHISKFCLTLLVFVAIAAVEFVRQWRLSSESWRRLTPQRREALLPLYLLAIPVISSVGTNNPILFDTLYSAGAWVAAVAILSVGTTWVSWRRFAGAWLIMVLVGSPLVFWGGLVTRPFGLGHDLFAQDQTIDGVGLDGVRVDAETARFLRETVALAPTSPDGVLLSFEGVLLINYSADRRIVGLPYYLMSSAPLEAAANLEAGCEEYPLAGRELVINHTLERIPDVVVDQLRACGVEYPEGWERIEVPMPYPGTLVIERRR